MKHQALSALCLLLLSLVAVAETNPVLLIEVAREGLRTPRTTRIATHQGLKLKEYNDTLSELGRQQQYLLGLEIRTRYLKSVFGAECNPLNIFAFAVSKESVMLSGQAHLLGICPLFTNKNITKDMVEKSYPPFDFPAKEQIGEELGLYATPYNFMPLPLHSTYNDPIFGAADSEKYPLPVNDLFGARKAEIDRKFADTLYPALAELAGLETDELTVRKVIDTVHELINLVESKRLRKISKKIVQAAKDFLHEYYRYYWEKENRDKYASMFFNELMLKLKNAVILRLNKVLPKPLSYVVTIEQPDYDYAQIKYYLYEVSDLQMYTYSTVMKFGNNGYIPPSSIFMFELHQTCDLSKEMSVEQAMKCFKLDVKYNDAEVNSRFCQSPCALDTFYAGLKEYFQKLLTV